MYVFPFNFPIFFWDFIKKGIPTAKWSLLSSILYLQQSFKNIEKNHSYHRHHRDHHALLMAIIMSRARHSLVAHGLAYAKAHSAIIALLFIFFQLFILPLYKPFFLPLFPWLIYPAQISFSGNNPTVTVSLTWCLQKPAPGSFISTQNTDQNNTKKNPLPGINFFTCVHVVNITPSSLFSIPSLPFMFRVCCDYLVVSYKTVSSHTPPAWNYFGCGERWSYNIVVLLLIIAGINQKRIICQWHDCLWTYYTPLQCSVFHVIRRKKTKLSRGVQQQGYATP